MEVTVVADNMACVEGSSEKQVIVYESDDTNNVPKGGYFYIYYNGTKSNALSVSATANEVQTVMNSFPMLDDITVNRYTHTDLPYTGYAWVIEFPKRYGNVELLGVDDSHLLGESPAVSVYSLVNISMVADLDDITGSFDIAVGSAVTAVPLAWDATDNAILTALNNLTTVGKAIMLGLHGDSETYSPLILPASVSSLTDTDTLTLVTNTYILSLVAVGDVIQVNNTIIGYISNISQTDLTSTSIILTSSFKPSATEFKVSIGTRRRAKQMLPGVVSVDPLAYIAKATVGSPNMEILIEDIPKHGTNTIYINQQQYNIAFALPCTSPSTYYCVTLSPAYQGTRDITLADNVPIFDEFVQLYLTETQSWLTQSQLAINDTIWIGTDELIIADIQNNQYYVHGKHVSQVYTAATAYRTGYGFERAILFKTIFTSVDTIRVLPHTDLAGTNLQIRVERQNGYLPGTYQIGGPSIIQTVAFRSQSYEDSITAQFGSSSDDAIPATFLIGFEGFNAITSDLGNTTLTYGSSAEDWKAAIESLVSTVRVTVTREGDGTSASYAYGYIYTITFWGAYSELPVKNLKVIGLDSYGITTFVNRLRDSEAPAAFGNRYIALNENSPYEIRVSSKNSAGLSKTSEIYTQSTALYGTLPSHPQTLIFGQYQSDTSISLFFNPPQYDGSLPVTTYLVEVDNSVKFEPTSYYYQSMPLSIVPEVQEIVVAFRSGDDVKTRDGTFTITFGGKVTAPIPYNISASDLEVTLNVLIGTRIVAIAPITVTRQVYNRGYKWRVTFQGYHGNIGLLQADYTMLIGDDPRMFVTEITSGNKDIYPGDFTYEVQTVRTDALSPIQGSFTLEMEGYYTDLIHFDETESSFTQKLAALPTVYTVSVKRELLSSRLRTYSWTVSFARMKKGNMAGASNLPPMVVHSSTLTPETSATVYIFEEVKGSSPFQLFVEKLIPQTQYYTRVIAYNDRGFSLDSAVANAATVSQSPPVTTNTLAIASGTALNVTWTPPPAASLQIVGVDGYKVEYYSSNPVLEVQVVTTSATGSLQEIQRITVDADVNNIAGYFRVSYQGETSNNIAWNATANGDLSVAQAISRLSTIGSVEVVRSLSRRVVQGLLVNGTLGSSNITVAKGSTSSLSKNDTIWISNQEFTIKSVTDSTIEIYSHFTVDTLQLVYVYKWSYGYTWDITFNHRLGDVMPITVFAADNWAGSNTVVKVDVLQNGVNPLSGTFRLGYKGTMTPELPQDISASDMKTALERLDTIAKVSVERYINGYGYDWLVTFVSELGDLDLMTVDDANLYGPFAVAQVASMVQGVLPQDYKQIFVSGAGTVQTTIDGLILGRPYQTRVSVHNIQGCSYPTISLPVYLSPKVAPSVPIDVSFFAISSSRLKLVWSQPVHDGGYKITQYKIEWDLTSGFANANVRYMTVDSTNTNIGNNGVLTYCYDIDIALSSSNLPRFARVSAFNTYKWSFPGLPTPPSAHGQILAPAPPSNVFAYATSSVGIMVTWQPPDTLICAFGGDGGTPITQYVVEWDVREDFSTPAAQAYIYDLKHLSYQIGGRNVLTGTPKKVLAPDTTYFIRVIAFNSVGASVPANYSGNVTTIDQPPSVPRNIQVSTHSETSLNVKWQTPLEDGGTTLEKYRLQYSTNDTFDYYQVLDFPIVPETQVIATEANSEIEVQAVRVLAAVTNERQSIRTQIVGVDEVQVVTTHADDVVNAVQRITTTAQDYNEIQSIELTGTYVPETQLIQTKTEDRPEIQRVEIYTPRINEVQTIGVIIKDIDTHTCVHGEPCTDVEQFVHGNFQLQFNPDLCGIDPDNEDGKFCKVAMRQNGFTDYACSDTTCLTHLISLNSASAIEDAICNIKSTNNDPFMKDKSGGCVTVQKSSETLSVDPKTGVYKYSYNITFDGNNLIGKVAPLKIMNTNVTYTNGSSTLYGSYTNQTTQASYNVGLVTQSNRLAYIDVPGNQPDGYFSLFYLCESQTVNVTGSVSADGLTFTVTSGVTEMELYQFLRLETTYYRIKHLDNSKKVATLEKTFPIPVYGQGQPFPIIDGEYGVFYSDPDNHLTGVSALCDQNRLHQTGVSRYSDIASDVRAKIRALSVIHNSTDSVKVERNSFLSNSSQIGYYWDITFYRQNGNLKPMSCYHRYLNQTNDNGPVVCDVKTLQDGSLIQGSFTLGMTYPHIYVGAPVPYNATSFPWNIDAPYMQQLLSAKEAFGEVLVTRVAYTPTNQLRWSGGYRYTIQFKTRNGNLPPMKAYNDMVSQEDAVMIEVGTHDNRLSTDDPGTAVLGNQITGLYGLLFTDKLGNVFNSTSTAFPIVNNVTGQALSAADFQYLLITQLFDGLPIVHVNRSAEPNNVMGYKYTIEFIGANVGGKLSKFKPYMNHLTCTSVANQTSTNRVGELCLNTPGHTCTLGVYYVNKQVTVSEVQVGAELYGTYSLSFNGDTTVEISFNAEVTEVENKLNSLLPISPSRVKVSRHGPMMTPDTQVLGYVWDITFNSNKWVDPTSHTNGSYIPGNWAGAPATWDDVWLSGYSKAWGKNVGPQELIKCSHINLRVTNGVSPSCTVEELVVGTAPLSGYFALELNSTSSDVINIQKHIRSKPIAHNAWGNSTESNGDGTSLQEILMEMDNIGEINVTRSDVNTLNGGYIWWITFLRDKSGVGGQFGNDCQQRDDTFHLCNSPGDVPALTFGAANLRGGCLSSVEGSPYHYNCSLISIISGDSDSSLVIPGSKAVQQIFIDNPQYDIDFYTERFRVSYTNATSEVFHSPCMYVNTSASDIEYILSANFSSLKRGIVATSVLDTVYSRNGQTITLAFLDEGPQHLISVSKCPGNHNINWTITSTNIRYGHSSTLNKVTSGVINGVIQRGDLTDVHITGETPKFPPTNLKWNAPAEGAGSIKEYLDTSSNHIVRVSRTVVDKYGSVQYDVRFVNNKGITPPGAGYVQILNVTQAAATNGHVYAPRVKRVQRGSDGLSGSFDINLHDTVYGPKTVYFDETPERLQKKLEQLQTVSKVFVEKFEYPSNITGGFGNVPVLVDGTLGGYEYRIYFTKNTGLVDGYSFPPGSGDLEPLSVNYTAQQSIFGTSVVVDSVTYFDGSAPIDGSFNITWNNTLVGTVPYDQQAIEIKYLLEDSGLFGQVTTNYLDRFMGVVPGVYVSVSRDSNYLTVEYDHPDQYTDIRGMIAPGDSFRIGGNLYPNSEDSFDGSPLLGQIEVAPQDPVFRPMSTFDRLVVPGDSLRIGGDSYQVLRTGEEVQVVSITCGKTSARGATDACGQFMLQIFYKGVQYQSVCISRPQYGDMTSAADIKQSLVSLHSDFNGLVISKLDSPDMTSVAYLLYFESDKLKGDMIETVIAEDGGCTILPTTFVSVVTQTQGGSISIQTVRTNVEAGYIEGNFFNLTYNEATTSCMAYGADASVVQKELLQLNQLSDQLLPFDVTLDPHSPSALIASSSVFGILNINDKINIPINNVDKVYTVTQVINGLQFYVIPNPDTLMSPTSHVYLRNDNSVQVARHGTGNSTSPVLKVTQTADEYINPDTKGFFKIKLNINGQEKISANCLRYHSTAEDFQTAINSMQFDFNLDGIISVLDNNHVRVSRDGDGAEASGFGYVYTLSFDGPALTFGSSIVLGDSNPTLEIIDKGHMGGCVDMNSTYIDSFYINYNTSYVGAKTWTTAVSNIQNTQQKLNGLVQAGDRVMVPGSSRPHYLYDVIDVTDTTVTVNEALYAASKGYHTFTVMEVKVVKAPFPEFTVQTVQEGEDAYTYDIYFTGAHLTDVNPLTIQPCSATPKQYGGMLFGLDLVVQEDPGSPVEQSIILSSQTPVTNPLSGYFKLVYFGNAVVGSNGYNGIPWGISAADLEANIGYTLSRKLNVIRTGAGSPEENYGYQYKITFPDVLSIGDVFPEMSVVTNGQISRPYFQPVDTADSKQLNDLAVSGTYTATQDYVFVVTIGGPYNKTNEFTWEMQDFDQDIIHSNYTSIRIAPHVKYALIHGVNISFGSSFGHNIGDRWAFTGVRVDSPLPLLATVLGDDNVLPTHAGLSDIIVTPGYQGTANSIVSAYHMSPMFTVADQSPLIWTLTTNDPKFGTPSATTLNYRIERKSNSSYVNTKSTISNSSCLAWNAQDYEIEEVLHREYEAICQPGTLDNCVTVTRSLNKYAAHTSYVYTIYIDTTLFNEPTAPQDEILYVNATRSGCNLAAVDESLISIAVTSHGSIHLPFTKYKIPLARLNNATVNAFYRSNDLVHVPIYKLNGNSWSIRYDSNLGDLPPIVITPTQTLSNGTELIVIDNVVQGDNPQDRVLFNLATGIEYYVRLQAYTRGPQHGYGNLTNAVSAIPSGTPPPVNNLMAVETLQVFEQQDVYIGASHVIEIQTVTTSAPSYSEIQEINLRAPQGSQVNGSYTLRFPTIQSIKLQSPNDPSYKGYFRLGYKSSSLSASHIKVPTTQYTTTCLKVTATAEDVKIALESLSLIDIVNVTRSSYGGYTSYFGYQYDIIFSGNLVAGSVQPLIVQYGTTESSCSGSFPPDLTVAVTRENPNQAVGLDTEIQSFTISAPHYIAQGQFQLVFDSVSTDCIDWNATSDDVMNALKSISSIDDVYVERYGEGILPTGNFGYTYHVFFTGNMLHLRSNDNANPFPSFIIQSNSITCSNNEMIKEFSYVKNGVLTSFGVHEYNLTIAVVQSRGYNLNSIDTTNDDLAKAFMKLPQFVQVYDIRDSLKDERMGHMFTITFALSMQNAPSLVCGPDSVFIDSNSVCSQNTIIDGNQIGGYFTLDNSRSLPYDISASALQYELQSMTKFGNVSVTRSAAVPPGGYTWTIQWLSATGNQPTLRFTNSLSGSGAKVTVQTLQNGNYLGGTYQLGYNGATTKALPYDATPDMVSQALLPLVGHTTVSRIGRITTEGGGVLRITFIELKGDVALLNAYYTNTLTGINAAVTVFEVVKGTQAQGNTMKLSFDAPIHCSFSEVQVGNCGAPVDYYSLDVGSAGSYTNTSYTIVPSYNIQIVRIAAPSLAHEVYYTDEDATGFFQLGYNNHYTAPISSHASETAIRDALERLPDIQTVSVKRSLSVMPLEATVRANPGDYNLVCDGICHLERLREGDVIFVNNLWFKVATGFVLVDPHSATKIPLALYNDSSITTFYNGAPINNEPVFIWARGFEYTIHFLAVSTVDAQGKNVVLPLDSPKHGLNPTDATVSVRHQDCNDCFLVPNLIVWRRYFLRLRGHNRNGLGAYASTTGTPKEVPGPPTDVSLQVITGTDLRLLFSPPAGYNSDIIAYIVQWDRDDQFTQVYGAGGASCTTIEYGQCTVTGAAIASSPPFNYLIQRLLLHNIYYVRVSAINSVSPRMDLFPRENVKWSAVVHAYTDYQAPSIPLGPNVITSGLTSLQVFFVPPLFNGGIPITNYTITWDSSPNFDNAATFGSVIIPVDQLEVLNIHTNQRIYEIHNLVTGVYYWVRVMASNSIGDSIVAVTPTSAQPGGKPQAPSSALVSTLRASDNKITTATLNWLPPYGVHSDGGVPITGYLIEWWTDRSIPDVQLVQYRSKNYPVAQLGQFTLTFSNVPNKLEITNAMSWKVSPYNVRSELLNMGWNTTGGALLGDISVEKSNILNKGYQWRV